MVGSIAYSLVLLKYLPSSVTSTVQFWDDMDELYSGLSPSIISYPVDSGNNFLGDLGSSSNTIAAGLSSGSHQQQQQQQQVVLADTHEVGMEMSDVIKAQIANHPFYPNLLSAYIECKKVGAPPEMASLLDEISKENYPISISCSDLGTDPELDEFMKSYCEVLIKYKEELSKPFDEATNFLSSIESQLTDLCKETLPSPPLSYQSTENAADGVSDDDICHGEMEATGSQESIGNPHQGDQELKEMLMQKYSGYLSSLRKEFLKKRKKGKLPKDARITLLEWWNTHYRWPYPTEEEKNRLSEITGLDQKQINNWFINQRKRHWRPSEDMRFALMEGVTSGGRGHAGGSTNPGSVYFDGGAT